MPDPSLYKENREIRLGNIEILPGSSTRVNYNVGTLPSGNRVSIHMEAFRSDNPGPHIMLIGGVTVMKSME